MIRIGELCLNSLFGRLYNLLKAQEKDVLEDYLTEIVADIFEDPELLADFLTHFTDEQWDELSQVEVTTQKTYAKLSGHASDSRPDLVISLRKGQKPCLVFFENKIDSGEGHEQLKRYADHLQLHEQDGVNTTLFYVTKRHDPKKRDEVIQTGSRTKFRQLRWYEFYKWLSKHPNPYGQKILSYMEEMQLNETRKFLPQDVYALQHMGRLQSMMDASLDGAVDETMTKYFGKAIGWSNRNVQMRDLDRYIKTNDQGNGIWVACGYYFTDDDYPLVSVMMEVNPNAKDRTGIVAAMKWVDENRDEWQGEDLQDPTKWSSISCDVSLLHFLGEDDHILAIQKFFIEKLGEMHQLAQQFPQLEWKI